MAELRIKTTRVLKDTVEANKNGAKIIIHEGGSRSSKTWSILQYLISRACNEPGLVITIARDKLTWVKTTVLKDFKDIILKYDLPVTPRVNINRPEQIYYINGSEIAFFGLDYTEKLHGRSQDIFWINEAMETRKADFDQLEMRTKQQGILDYNPSNDQHWIFELTRRPDVVLIKSTMLDNPFLPDSIINKIKGYEPTAENIERGTADKFMWQVYGLGNRARLQGRIFTNWDEVGNIPENAEKIGYGLDFGYTNDPSAMVEVSRMNNELYLRELIYETGLTNPQIADKMKGLGIDKGLEIFADSSEPKSIQEIYEHGFNIRGVTKGADSINFGIDTMKQYKIHILKDSYNGINEFRKYKWAEDRTGKRLNKPVDANNHFCDASRYLIFMKLAKQAEVDPVIKFI